MKELGTKVSELRQKLGLTQEQFAEAIHSNRTTVSKWESDKVSQQPTINDIITICNVYGTDMDYFINDFRKSPLNFLDLVDENAPKTIVYSGITEVSNAYTEYAKELGL